MDLLASVTNKIKSISLNGLPGAILTEFFPETLSGFLNEYLDGVTAKDFYYELKKTEGRGLVSFLDKGTQARLRAVVPDDLDWLNLEWFLKQIANEHRDIVGLILSSAYVTKEIERQINTFKEEICNK